MNKIFSNKIILLALITAILLLGGFYLLKNRANPELNERPADIVTDYKNASYLIDGQSVQLTDGIAETEAAPRSASKVITRYFGNEVMTDLNDDGREDVVFLLTQETGGSGTFFYVVAALNTENGYVGSDGYLLGDRIAPQTTEMSRNPNHKAVIVVNYHDRGPEEPMSAQPSFGKSVWLKLNPNTMQLGVVEQNFPGEADPNTMTLEMKKWTWLATQDNDGQEIKPNKSEAFVLSLKSDGSFSATTDCNGMGGHHTAEAGAITFSQIASTQMFCEGSQETDFTKILEEAESYHFTSRGELIFKLNAGTATFN